MLYLIIQMWICLLLAFLLGLLLGLFLKKSKKCTRNHADNTHSHDTSGNTGVNSLMAAAPAVNTEVTDLDTLVDVDGEGYIIETLEGIGPKTGELFRSVGIATVGDLLRKAHSQSLRDKLANKLEIKVEPLNDWAGMSDLLRIKGMDHQSSELAYSTGAYNIEELAKWEPANFVNSMEAKNNSGPQLIAPSVAPVDQVADWIAQAKNIKSIVTF